MHAQNEVLDDMLDDGLKHIQNFKSTFVFDFRFLLRFTMFVQGKFQLI